ncbi:MAG: EamA family transporter [Myxococcaceae bacterium]
MSAEAPLSNRTKGAVLGLSAAALFGASAPVAKLLLPTAGPLVLAALLYVGGGLGLTLGGLLPLTRPREARPSRADLPLLVGVILCGGVLGPVLMLVGLGRVSGVAGSLLLNLEGPFTVVLALFVFGEHLGRRAMFAAGLIFVGAVILALRPGEVRADWLGALAIAAACLSWAIDNNLTQRLSLREPIATVRIKALGAGVGMLLIAVATGQPFPRWQTLIAALGLGCASYGLSIVLDMYALRLVGAAREAAYFATAPFIGAVFAVPLLGERLGTLEVLAGAIMGVGVAVLVRDRHGHVHAHEPLEHEHLHTHDQHHRHEHAGPFAEPHSHSHRHVALVHDHPHVSDVHHRHEHK